LLKAILRRCSTSRTLSTSKYLLLVTKFVKDADMEKVMTEVKEFAQASTNDLDKSVVEGSIDLDNE